jgi:thiol-disulfide isomerase/thioredoxin
MNKKLLKEATQNENIILFFYADWCGGCKVAHPIVEKIVSKLNFKLIPINENEELENEYEVDFYPHLVLASKGKIKHYRGATEIKSLYESII